MLKEGLHPKYEETTIACGCGAVYKVGSTKKNIRVEVCANCHPFYTGQQRQNIIGGRAERFRQKYAKAESK